MPEKIRSQAQDLQSEQLDERCASEGSEAGHRALPGCCSLIPSSSYQVHRSPSRSSAGEPSRGELARRRRRSASLPPPPRSLRLVSLRRSRAPVMVKKNGRRNPEQPKPKPCVPLISRHRRRLPSSPPRADSSLPPPRRPLEPALKYTPDSNPFSVLATPSPPQRTAKHRPPKRSGAPPPPRAPVVPAAGTASKDKPAASSPSTNGAPAEDPRLAEVRALLDKGLVAQAYSALSPHDKPPPSLAQLSRIERLSGHVSRFKASLKGKEYDAALREWDGAREAWLERDKGGGVEPGVPWEAKLWRCEALEGGKKWNELENYTSCVLSSTFLRAGLGGEADADDPTPAAPSSRTRRSTASRRSSTARPRSTSSASSRAPSRPSRTSSSTASTRRRSRRSSASRSTLSPSSTCLRTFAPTSPVQGL